jgi:hypothetical protein
MGTSSTSTILQQLALLLAAVVATAAVASSTTTTTVRAIKKTIPFGLNANSFLSMIGVPMSGSGRSDCPCRDVDLDGRGVSSSPLSYGGVDGSDPIHSNWTHFHSIPCHEWVDRSTTHACTIFTKHRPSVPRRIGLKPLQVLKQIFRYFRGFSANFVGVGACRNACTRCTSRRGRGSARGRTR